MKDINIQLSNYRNNRKKRRAMLRDNNASITTLVTRCTSLREIAFARHEARNDPLCSAVAERRPIQFYPNEPCDTVKSNRVGRRVNGEGLQFPRRTFLSYRHIVKGVRDIAHHILGIFHENCLAIAEGKNGGKQYTEGWKGRGETRVRKRKKVACGIAASLLVIRFKLYLAFKLGVAIEEDYVERRRWIVFRKTSNFLLVKRPHGWSTNHSINLQRGTATRKLLRENTDVEHDCGTRGCAQLATVTISRTMVVVRRGRDTIPYARMDVEIILRSLSFSLSLSFLCPPFQVIHFSVRHSRCIKPHINCCNKKASQPDLIWRVPCYCWCGLASLSTLAFRLPSFLRSFSSAHHWDSPTRRRLFPV